MIINVLNNENIVTLTKYTQINYDDWWKHDGYGNDVTSIRFVNPPIYE